MTMDLETFIARWATSGAAERANKDTFLNELCQVLEVDPPDPTTGDPARDRYVFEKDAVIPHEGGWRSVGKMDLYKEGCFILEAKQGSSSGSRRTGTARRDTPGWHIAMRDAFGQALGYARVLDNPPPFIITCDIGYCFELHATFDGGVEYRPFPDAQHYRLYLRDLGAHVDLLRAIFVAPRELDPSRHAARVTRDVASHLAGLAQELEAAGHPSQTVATFLMRCIFTMFAEDVGLLPDKLFREAVERHWIPNPRAFPGGVMSLWSAMNNGDSFGFVGKLLRFNGGLFANATALPLEARHLVLLLEAAKCDWADVEPAIFGTLLERALNAKERHALGAHYTPRAYVERLVRPTVEEPLRAEWALVQAEVRQHVANDRLDAARAAVHAFQKRLSAVRVLDPACGTGNFLYVTLDLFKRLEAEVLGLLSDLGEKQSLLLMGTASVTPAQFLGLEVKPWAREIAELVLWIGYLQWFRRTFRNINPPEPVLWNYGNIRCQDAVLAFDARNLKADERGVPITRWDGETFKVHPVTGEKVPDERARAPVYEYVNPRKAEWPAADFVVGNPPFVGNWRMRSALGDGYVEALRGTWDTVPDSCDYVMYWWEKAATLVREGKLERFGLITTNSISQTFSRRVVQRHLEAKDPISLVFAVPDHPWVDSEEGADVRIAMTVAQAGELEGTLATVVDEWQGGGEAAEVTLAVRRGRIHANLTIGPDVAGAVPLRSNEGLSCPGVKLHGAGFIVTPQEAAALGLGRIDGLERHIRPYFNGRDLAARARGVMVIDLFGLEIEEVQRRFPEVYQRVLERVKPERDQNNRSTYKLNWWIFGEPRANFRPALAGLPRYISTVETSKHRFFVFMDKSILPDNKLVNIALDDAWALGVLSSRIHVAWALAAGGRLGIGNDPVYVKTKCFDPFPFPAASPAQQARIREVAERLDAHRKRQQAAHPELTLTGMYNVLEKLRAGDPLSDADRRIHLEGAVTVLKELHDELDAAVFDAYGWPADLSEEQVLERLVALNRARAAEELEGSIRWLRPAYQDAAGAGAVTQIAFKGLEAATEAAPADDGVVPWPKKLAEQTALVRGQILRRGGGWSVEQVAKSYKRARRTDVEAVLEALAALGLLVAYEESGTRRWMAPG